MITTYAASYCSSLITARYIRASSLNLVSIAAMWDAAREAEAGVVMTVSLPVRAGCSLEVPGQ
ncbi:hypothetical protein SAMN05216489_05899 [Streptomyces sp. 3213]|nr:hypothetical protein SAMN05216489_05899 [Streptomyces sp. 3213] [Streptomyces sp. 3213.3]